MRSDSPKSFHRFWYDKRITSMPEVKKIAKAAYQITKKREDVIGTADLVEKVAKNSKLGPDAYERILSIIGSDMRFKKLGENEWGLQEWRHINPKSIHDKALIVMRKIRKAHAFYSNRQCYFCRSIR
jgi:DNA-directed RNA polymerase delta subunit